MEESKKAVEIKVNEKAVKMPDHKTTGLGIKQAAIAQGVAIRLDFNLFRLDGNKQHPVTDQQEVTVHEGQRFRAVASDDNS